MSFLVDTRHYAFSSQSSVVRDTAAASYTFATDMFSTPPPASAIYQTVAVESFGAINGWYTVEPGRNDAIVCNMQRVTLSPGFYTATQLAATVQSLLRPVVGSTFTCTYSSTTGRMTLASNNGTNFTIFGSPATTAWKLLGMLDLITYSGFSSYTFENLADMQTTSRIIIASNLPTRNKDAWSNMTFLGTFAVSAPPYQFFEVNTAQYESIIDLNQSIAYLQIQLLDQNGQPAITRAEWTLVLQVSVFHRPDAIPYVSSLGEFVRDVQQQQFIAEAAAETEADLP